MFDEVVPFRVHVVEGAANKEVSTLPPSGCLAVLPSIYPCKLLGGNLPLSYQETITSRQPRAAAPSSYAPKNA